MTQQNIMEDGTPYPFASGPVDNGYKLPINTKTTISKMERVKKKINMPIELDEKGKLQYKIFQIYPDYHDLEDNKKEEILSALIQWACMEIYKLKEQ